MFAIRLVDHRSPLAVLIGENSRTKLQNVREDSWARCPGCGRHVLLEDEVASTRWPFCGAGILDRAASPVSAIVAVAGLDGRPGSIAKALRRVSGPPPGEQFERQQESA